MKLKIGDVVLVNYGADGTFVSTIEGFLDDGDAVVNHREGWDACPLDSYYDPNNPQKKFWAVSSDPDRLGEDELFAIIKVLNHG